MKEILLVFSVVAAFFTGCSDKDKDDMPGGARPDGTYFKITVDGVKQELPNIHYARSGANVHFATYGEDGLPNLNLTVKTKTEDDFRGTYTYHYDLSPGTSIILWGIGPSNGYESHWWDCPDQPLLVTSPGSIKIENIERTGGDEFVTGSFSVVQYQPQGNCPYAEVKEVKITGEFRLKRLK